MAGICLFKILIGRGEGLGVMSGEVEIELEGAGVSLEDVGEEDGLEVGEADGLELGEEDGLGVTSPSPVDPPPKYKTIAVTAETENTKINKTANNIRDFLFNQIPFLT